MSTEAGTIDAIFHASPNTPPQAQFPTATGTVNAPKILIGTGDASLWISLGTVNNLTINGESFTDSGWQLLAKGTDVYITLTDPTKSAVLATLAERSATGALQRLSQAFLQLLA